MHLVATLPSHLRTPWISYIRVQIHLLSTVPIIIAIIIAVIIHITIINNIYIHLLIIIVTIPFVFWYIGFGFR